MNIFRGFIDLSIFTYIWSTACGIAYDVGDVIANIFATIPKGFLTLFGAGFAMFFISIFLRKM